MKQTTLDDLRTTLRPRKTSTFSTVTGTMVDAGPGRSFVGFWAPAALAAGDITFNGLPSVSEADSEGVVAADLGPIAKKQEGGTAGAATVNVDGTHLYYPLDPATFNGLRYLQPISSVDQDGKTIDFVSKPL